MSTISAGTLLSNALVQTGDTSGNLVFQTNGNTTAMTIDTNQNVTYANGVSFTGVIGGNGANISSMNASNLTSGTVATARLASGTANSSTYLRGDQTWAVLSAPNNGTLTMNTSGTGLTGSATFTADQSGNSTFTVTSNANSANGASTIVARGASGEFSAGAITAASFTGDGSAVSSINASNLSSGTVNSARISGSYTGITGVGTLTAGTWNAGTIGILYGGTGATTRQDAMDALAGAVTSGQYLRGNGTDVVMSAIQAGDVPTLNQNTTGTAANLTGSVFSTGSTGYYTIRSNGLIIQWGSISLSANTNTTGSYAITFPTASLATTSGSPIGTRSGTSGWAIAGACPNNTSTYRAWNTDDDPTTVWYIAVGY